MYREIKNNDDMKVATCPECGCKRLLYHSGKLKCTNCDHVIGQTYNKYGAKKAEFNGKIYDSKFEASSSADLDLRKRAGDIKDYDTQYRIEAWCYREDGVKAFLVKHKVDFRIHHNDGSYELYESKGYETDDYKWRRKFLEFVWLPMHPDYTYTVVKQNKYNKMHKQY
jgi:uncharacterized Zn finger protein (UPF0148 family)